MNKETLKFMFNDDSLEMKAKEKLILTNTGNSISKFTWLPSNVFDVDPKVGTILPGYTSSLDIWYTPSPNKQDEELLTMKIEDGIDQRLKCIGQVNETKCNFVQKTIDFGTHSVGIPITQVVTIKNYYKTNAIFKVLTDIKDVTITPKQGKIMHDSKIDIKLELETVHPGILKAFLEVSIRGGKDIKMPITAQIIVPDVIIEEKSFLFEDVTLGGRAEKEITL